MRKCLVIADSYRKQTLKMYIGKKKQTHFVYGTFAVLPISLQYNHEIGWDQIVAISLATISCHNLLPQSLATISLFPAENLEDLILSEKPAIKSKIISKNRFLQGSQTSSEKYTRKNYTS